MSPGVNTRAEFAVYDCLVFLCEIPAIRNFCTVILRPTFGGRALKTGYATTKFCPVMRMNMDGQINWLDFY